MRRPAASRRRWRPPGRRQAVAGARGPHRRNRVQRSDERRHRQAQAVGGLFYEFTRRVCNYYEDFDREARPSRTSSCAATATGTRPASRSGCFTRCSRARAGASSCTCGMSYSAPLSSDGRLAGSGVRGRHPARAARRVATPVFIDATYEGDLAALAGVPLPRRAARAAPNTTNRTPAASICASARHELLAGSTGEADNATQAYCFRFHVTHDPATRVPIDKPENFNRDDYTVRARGHPRQGRRRVPATSSRSTRCRTASSN